MVNPVTQCFHVHSAAVGPRPVVAEGLAGGVDDAGAVRGQFLGRHPQVRNLAAAIVLDEHVGAGGQVVGPSESFGLSEVQPRRGGKPGAGVLHKALVLELLGVGDLQHLGTVLGQRARHDVAGDHVRGGQHPQPRQRARRRCDGSGSLSPILMISTNGLSARYLP